MRRYKHLAVILPVHVWLFHDYSMLNCHHKTLISLKKFLLSLANAASDASLRMSQSQTVSVTYPLRYTSFLSHIMSQLHTVGCSTSGAHMPLSRTPCLDLERTQSILCISVAHHVSFVHCRSVLHHKSPSHIVSLSLIQFVTVILNLGWE